MNKCIYLFSNLEEIHNHIHLKACPFVLNNNLQVELGVSVS